MMIVERCINTICGSNTYILYSERDSDTWVIDPGDVIPILQNLSEYLLKGILITHSHFDHIYGLNELVVNYPRVSVYTSGFGKEGLYSSKLNLSCYREEGEFIYCHAGVKEVREGDVLAKIDGLDLLVLETPGHDKGCLSYEIGNYLFTGDAFIPFTKVVTSFPFSDKIDAGKSVTRILNFPSGTLICPGHGEIVSISEAKGFFSYK